MSKDPAQNWKPGKRDKPRRELDPEIRPDQPSIAGTKKVNPMRSKK